ncbi:MAG TPA: restriction endonuclease subunit S [Flavobacterium sp.]|uniref:restriction endonuclease subunit S n=1 Tax=Flavobacterium sp. TaxID=239 RepID=UPI002B4B11FF|nr:restriction endonuclease subunit S [Flavobacterium sp.]HLO73216.1 restriction endonuclease subunit S [Flavobacterium sp.]
MKKNWQIKKLGEICNFVGGGTPSKNNSDFWNGNIPWASIKDIKGQYLNKTSDYITDLGLKKSATNLAHPNEIILATRINPGRPIITKIKTSINQDLKIVRPKIEIHRDFLYYLFLNIENDIIKLSNGTTVLGITLNSLNEIDIHLPTLETQQAIISKIEELFSELDKGIEDLKTAQQQLKTYRQSVLKWAFEGKLTNEDLREGELPKGWEWTTFQKVCIKIGDIDHKMPKQLEKGYPYVSTKDFTNNLKISFDNAKYISEEDYLNLSRKIKPEKGDIIFPRYGTIGKNILVDFDKEFLVSYSCAVIKPNHDIVLSKYIYLFSLSPKITDEIRKYVVKTTQANIGIASIKSFVFPLPSIEEQQKVIDELESRLSVADKMEESIAQSLQQAEALRQSILKKAFNGELV